MPEAAADSKSPKAPRRLRPAGEPLRQVHFQTPASAAAGIKTAASAFPPASPSAAPFTSSSASTTNSTTKPPTTAAANPASASTGDSFGNQPDSFPQLGAPPHSSLGAGQWHTAADPTQSVKLPGQPFAGFAAPGAGPGASPFQLHPQLFAGPFSSPLQQQQLHHHHHVPVQLQPHAAVPTATPITYIGSPIAMADYQNAAPMPTGVNFQPPVPDTTFGPIPHVYVPRFDGSLMPAAVQVGLPSVQFVSRPATAAPVSTATYTVVMPKTYYYNGYTYYASSVSGWSLQPTVTGVPVAQPSYVVAQQPAVVPQPFVGQQPVMIGGQPASAAIPFQQVHTVPAMGVPGAGGMPVFAGNGGQIPDVSGLGKTPAEETIRQLQFAHTNKLFEPQEFKPSDDDPSRFYYVREVDGNWTQRNRFTIDHLGDCRWYVTDEGWFYAVRMPN
ncbi:hypothetical protein MKX07_004281 [Trichoderma sp. CBMAI-0711]|uniref:Uncharacterized protein n=1 Tax=Trichoderma parareesei TaxID=858221 RepID=A0A2H2Z8N2_TRIPA|nr:hypothetical protein MKX07_004281 [Trichoderma sp. CBMAI-0711]OTA03773.1 hypothetical protein A9Z42_0042630 [Trichoderma parareesei]